MATFGEILVVIGAAWSVLAAVGVNRFGDVYARMHAATKTTTLGVLFVLFGAATSVDAAAAVKLLIAGVLLFLTAPIGAHLVGRAVHRNVGSAPMHIDSIDELRDAEDRGVNTGPPLARDFLATSPPPARGRGAAHRQYRRRHRHEGDDR